MNIPIYLSSGNKRLFIYLFIYLIMKTINVYNYKYSQKRKKGGGIHHRYIY